MNDEGFSFFMGVLLGAVIMVFGAHLIEDSNKERVEKRAVEKGFGAYRDGEFFATNDTFAYIYEGG